MENKTLLDKLESINEQLNLIYYWIIFLKYKRIIFIIPIFFALLGFLIALNINPIFQSTATLVIEQAAKKIVNIEEVYDGESRRGFSNSNYINNQIQILKSDEVIGAIILNEKNKNKILKLYKAMPEQFFAKNFNFLKKFVLNKKKKKEKINLKKYKKKN